MSGKGKMPDWLDSDIEKDITPEVEALLAEQEGGNMITDGSFEMQGDSVSSNIYDLNGATNKEVINLRDRIVAYVESDADVTK